MGIVEILFACDDPGVVERLESVGIEAAVANFDLPVELLEAVGVSIPEWASSSKRFEVVVRTPLERFLEVKDVVKCKPISYKIEVHCITRECVARAVTVLSRHGANVYIREGTVYGFGEGDVEKIIMELKGGTNR